MSIFGIDPASKRRTLGDLTPSRLRTTASKRDAKPVLPTMPETATQRDYRERRERRKEAARRRQTPATGSDWMPDLDAATRAWAVADRSGRALVVLGLAGRYPRSYGLAQRQIAARAVELRLADGKGRLC